MFKLGKQQYWNQLYFILMKVESAWGAGAGLTRSAGVEALLFEEGPGEDSRAKQEQANHYCAVFFFRPVWGQCFSISVTTYSLDVSTYGALARSDSGASCRCEWHFWCLRISQALIYI